MFIHVYWKQIWIINSFVSKKTKNTYSKANSFPTQHKFRDKSDAKIKFIIGLALNKLDSAVILIIDIRNISFFLFFSLNSTKVHFLSSYVLFIISPHHTQILYFVKNVIFSFHSNKNNSGLNWKNIDVILFYSKVFIYAIIGD